MELVTFTEGVQNIRTQRDTHVQVETPSSRAFVPKGESVVQHTEKLFVGQASNEALLDTLMASENAIGMDPTEFDAMGFMVEASLTNLEKQSGTMFDVTEQQTIAAAVTVLNALIEDRMLLQTNLTALEKV